MIAVIAFVLLIPVTLALGVAYVRISLRGTE